MLGGRLVGLKALHAKTLAQVEYVLLSVHMIDSIFISNFLVCFPLVVTMRWLKLPATSYSD